MQIVKTKNHLIYSADQGAPSHACLGTCQKVWWTQDIAERIAAAAKPACPQCGGELTQDIPNGHYSVVVDNVGPIETNGAKIMNAGLNISE